MMKAASVRVTVDFTGRERPAGYIVSIAPEGGEVVGSYGGCRSRGAGGHAACRLDGGWLAWLLAGPASLLHALS